jgi:hypothetical protein
MFYHPKTETEIVSLKNYLFTKHINKTEDYIDSWIRMVSTNRLTGHSSGFFSVYTLPPNQAVSQENQMKINFNRKQMPEYRDTKKLILKKSKQLISKLSINDIIRLKDIGNNALFLTNDSRNTQEITDSSVNLTITSPPFLDVVQYADDNWLRAWFNSVSSNDISKKITMAKKVDEWCKVMADVLKELYRITASSGYVAFEVGEVRNGKIRLDELIIPLGVKAGFHCLCLIINKQEFTKTANIWGISNNTKGTNTNRIVLFQK